MTIMNNNSIKTIIDRFFKFGNPAMQYIGINVIIFLIFGLFGIISSLFLNLNFNEELVRPYLGFPGDIHQIPFRFYTLISYAFLHQDFFHILFNMLWLYWMGNLFLDFMKNNQFHLVYWGGAIVGAIFYLLVSTFGSSNYVAQGSTLIGASAAVMAIFAAITTLVPNYSIRLIIFGDVKLKYLLLVYVILDLIGTAPGANNIGGNLAHLGGFAFGFAYVKLLQNGTDLSKFFKRKPKLKVVKNPTVRTSTAKNVSQEEIDAILDKISKNGYEGLSAREKQTLFDAKK